MCLCHGSRGTQDSPCLLPPFLHSASIKNYSEGRPENETNLVDSSQSDLVFSCSLVCSPPTVGEVQDVYGCALFSEYPVATILRDLSDVYAFEEGETPPTCAEQGPSMYALLFIGFFIWCLHD